MAHAQRTSPLRARTTVTTAALALAVAVATAVTAPGSANAAPTAADRPTAVVAMGDSFSSGEGAGAYEAGTDQPGDFCHRSTRSAMQTAPFNGIDRRISLACSGAGTQHVALDGEYFNSEAPQAQQLRAVARDNQVKIIMLTIGANNVGFANLVLDCIKAYFLLGPRCERAWKTRLPERLAAAAPRIRAVIDDIRSVMRDDGYADSDYQFVLQSYSSPITEDNRYLFTRAFQGCPMRLDDSKWARESVIPQFTTTIGRVAAEAGVRFLDLGPALRSREVCARGISHSQEWAVGVNIDITQIRNGLGQNLVQHSMHPSALGHVQLGRCLSEFVAESVTAARCVMQANGNLAAVAASLSSLASPKAPATVPDIAEPPLIEDRGTAFRMEAARTGKR